jgi:3-deoxy-D-manno-octulosonate 8-phosphate phosphatase (KDO 8-P phosphatase)
MPSRLPPQIRGNLEPIRLLVLDVDGVLTDGSVHIGADGEEIKTFNVRDGLGLRLLMDAGIDVGVITGRSSPAVSVRCTELGIRPELVFIGSRDKDADLDRMLSQLSLEDHEMAAVGDDLPDLPMLDRAGFAFCPADAATEVLAACDHVCGRNGGRGAVREAAEILLKAQRRWTSLIEQHFRPGRGRR